MRLENDNTGKWWEIMLGWKWPHQGFTLGYDIVQPDEQHEENELIFITILLYLGPLSIIYNWGNYNWSKDNE